MVAIHTKKGMRTALISLTHALLSPIHQFTTSTTSPSKAKATTSFPSSLEPNQTTNDEPPHTTTFAMKLLTLTLLLSATSSVLADKKTLLQLLRPAQQHQELLQDVEIRQRRQRHFRREDCPKHGRVVRPQVHS
jgi:hypothetical protein